MLKFIDISNWQDGINLEAVLQSVDGVIVKATESTNYVDAKCDNFFQRAKASGKKLGFYHFARPGDAVAQADFFYNNCRNYFKQAIPVLDWEVGVDVAWVNRWCARIHELTGVYPWVYANAWRFNQGTVDLNCGRWVAGYPGTITDPSYGLTHDMPYTVNNGVVCAWQFTSSGRISGYGGNLDCNVFYGSAAAWDKYAGGSAGSYVPAGPSAPAAPSASVNVTYALRKLNGAWWPDVTNFNNANGDGYAGAPNQQHDLLAIKVDHGSIRYRVHTVKSNWLPWVSGFNKNDVVNGCAGNPGEAIDGVQVYYETPSGETYQQAWYRSQTTQRAGWLGVCCDDGKSVKGYDGWAGLIGEPMDRLQIAIGTSNPF